MTIAELKERIEASPPGSLIPRDWLLEQINEIPEANWGSMAWVIIKEASQITGLSETYLRRKAPGWASFDEPEIRVWKINPKKHSSPWLFSTEDCEAYRERHKGGSQRARGRAELYGRPRRLGRAEGILRREGDAESLKLAEELEG